MPAPPFLDYGHPEGNEMNEPKYAIVTEMRKRDGAQNQDCGAAERLLMADGNFAYVAALADGVSCCDRPREAASLAISHFRRAIEDASIEELSDDAMRTRWLESWTSALDEEVGRRARDGYATFCAIAVLPYPEEKGYGVLSLNVGDSSSFLVTPQDSRCVSMKPSDGGRPNSGDDGLLRGVGISHRGAPLIDMDYRTFPAGFSGYFWVGCDGVFNYVMGSDLRELCADGKFAFRELPQAVLALSEREGRRLGKKALDNATAAVVGVNVPETRMAPVASTDVKLPPRSFCQRLLDRLAAIPKGPALIAIAAIVILACLAVLVGRKKSQKPPVADSGNAPVEAVLVTKPPELPSSAEKMELPATNPYLDEKSDATDQDVVSEVAPDEPLKATSGTEDVESPSEKSEEEEKPDAGNANIVPDANKESGATQTSNEAPKP